MEYLTDNICIDGKLDISERENIFTRFATQAYSCIFPHLNKDVFKKK